MTDPIYQSRPRLLVLDVARGLALLAMASYHFTWDLEHFGYQDPGLTAAGGWKIYARCIAGTFLFLAGTSLVLAHGDAIRWRKFWRRWAGICAGALAISAATYFTDRDTFIFFGILHEIALASLIGLLFLRVPAVATALVAGIVVAAPAFAQADLFNHWPLWWVGLSTALPRSNDYVPVFPWLGPLLFGVAASRLAARSGAFDRLAAIRPGGWSRPLTFIGRHSLLFYLVHQPLLFGCVWLASQVFPPSHERFVANQRVGCEADCNRQAYDAPFCKAYCGCLIDRLDFGGRLVQSFPANDVERATLDQARAACYETASGPAEGTTP